VQAVAGAVVVTHGQAGKEGAAMAQGTPTQVVHPWVGEGERRIRFGIAYGAQDPSSTWTETRDYVQTIEGLGFDSFWAIDHPSASVSGADCWTTLAVLAASSRTIRLGPLVSCVYYRNPALLARMAADVDRLSEGRLVLGLGIGDNQSEFARLGIPFPPASERQQALDETIRIVRGLWGTEPFTFGGRHFQVAEAYVRPGPVQQPYVPLLIAGGGERGTLRQVAQYADASNFGAHRNIGGAFTRDDVVRKLDVLRTRCEEQGRPYEAVLRTHTTLLLFLAETDAALQEKLAAVPRATREHFAPSTMAGTPRDVIRYFRTLVEAGMQYFITFIYPKDVETVRLLAEQVVPEVVATGAATPSQSR
jgi:alkanesulfonate monooxygenase SsuD/methylene tetrahydromethanopterin reductase-like flavin-dependent oxidoreductase (luciferase family)